MQDLMLLDMTPLPMGLVTVGGVMTKLSKRSTTTPHQGGSNLDDKFGQPAEIAHQDSRGRATTNEGNNLLGEFH